MQFEQRNFLRLLVDSNAPKKKRHKVKRLLERTTTTANQANVYSQSHISKPLSKDVEDKRKFDRL